MACFTDASGVQQCPQNVGGVQSTCDALQANPACSFVRSACTLVDTITGNCHNFTDTYDCGNDVSVPGASTSSTTFVCPGQIRCVGTECFNPRMDGKNTGFKKAAASLSSVQMMQMDTKCLTVGNCEVFKGEIYDCKKAIGGIQNCCNKPAGTSLVQYMQTTYAAWDAVKASETVAGIQKDGMAVVGVLKDVGNGVVSTLPEVTRNALTSAYDSIMGPAAQTNIGSTATATSLTQPLYQAMGSMLEQMSPGLGKEIFEFKGGSFSGGLNTTAGSMGSMLNTVMVAYMYIQIAILIIQLIWACEKREYELSAKRELKSCHYVGSYCSEPISAFGVTIGCLVHKESYCCFSSPLARIMQEQGRPQLGKGWGTPEMPSCEGYSIDQMSSLNFDSMDLSEWVAILSISGKMPQSLQAADTSFAIDKLTSMQTPIGGTVQPQSTPGVISNALPDKTAGETARSKVRSSMGF